MASTGQEEKVVSRKDEVHKLFKTREGLYKLMSLSEYTRPSQPLQQNGANNVPMRLSFVSVTDPCNGRVNDVLAFNIGKEFYAYFYNGIRKAADLTRPIEKKNYKGPSPTCHEFNCYTAKSDNITLLVGFTHGQIQLVEIMTKEYAKLFNEERLIDNTKVTCVRWVPHLPNQFLVSHSSGYLYVYDDQLPCSTSAPTYQILLKGSGYAIETYSAKRMNNPLYRWFFDGGGTIHEFAFSPCARYLAIVFASGFMKVFNYHRMELVSVMRSYFGGLRCVAWSPDGRYIVTGGEDDLMTVWSFAERRIICRCAGHQSWINCIAFDPFMVTYPDLNSKYLDSGDGPLPLSLDDRDTSASGPISYRIGSVGDDTFLCLWELTEDVLSEKPCQAAVHSVTEMMEEPLLEPNGNLVRGGSSPALRPLSATLPTTESAEPRKFLSLQISDQHRAKAAGNHSSHSVLFDKLNGSKSQTKANGFTKTSAFDEGCWSTLGSHSYPRVNDIPLLEPMVHKKIANDRVTAIVFREDCIVTACLDGIVSTWSRPGRVITSGYL